MAISSIQVLFFTMSNMNKHFILIDLLLVSSIHTFITVKKTDLGFYFYNSANSSNGIKVDITNVTDVNRVGFDPDKDTFFYFHGYKDIFTSENHGQKVKNAILKNNDVNVFMFDWSVPAKIPYPFLLLTIRPTANYGGEMIQQFATNGALNLSRTTLCGHSFGAIVAGHIGYLLNGRASQAIGLDPTSGLLSVQLTFKGMTTASAKYVQIIHTDLFMGDIRALGTADYYVNGGKRQPRCGIEFGKGCSHLLALDYFVESVLHNDFTATSCSCYWLYEMGLCANNNVSCMGGYYLDTKARGTYYVDTNLDEPYGKGKCNNQSTTTKISVLSPVPYGTKLRTRNLPAGYLERGVFLARAAEVSVKPLGLIQCAKPEFECRSRQPVLFAGTRVRVVVKETDWKDKTRYQNRPRTVDVSMEISELFKVFPEINEQILDEQLIYHKKFPDLRDRYSRFMYYNIHDINTKFLSRAIFTVHSYRLLEKPSLLTEDNIRRACILGWCNKMIDCSIIMDDDIADATKIRYNKPTWHQLEGVSINDAILDAAFMESAFHFLIINNFSNHPQYVNIHKELLRSYANTNVSQLYEIRKHKVEDLEKFHDFAKFYIMTQPVVASALYLANIDDKDAHAASEEICLDIARFQKIDDDVKGIMTPFSEKLKECTDISEGRTSWLAIEAYRRSNEAQRKILREHYGKNNENSVRKVHNLFEDLRLVEVYENLKEEFYEKTYSKINELPKTLPPQLYTDLLNYTLSGNYRV